MRHDLSNVKSILIQAEPAKVWRCVTNPETIATFLFGTQTITDWKVGSAIIFKGEYKGQSYSDHGVILENIPLKKLSYSYWTAFSGLEDKPENYSVVTYTLVEKEQGITEFSWRQKGFANEDGLRHSQQGLPILLEQIKAIAER